MLDLSIVTVGHNHRSDLEQTLDALFEQKWAVKFEVILVDNVSTDGTVPMLQQQFPGVAVIRNDDRHGFARNVNIGIRNASRGRYVLLLNPDVQCLPGSLEALVEFLDGHPECGIAGPKLLNPDGTLQYSCRRFSNPIVPLLRFLALDRIFPGLKVLRQELMSDWDHDDLRKVDYVTGACMIVRRAAIEQTGLMDEAFFLYCEDQDWCLRMWQHNWKIFYLPQAIMIHGLHRDSAGRLFGRMQRIHLVSLIRLFYKHGLRIRRPSQ